MMLPDTENVSVLLEWTGRACLSHKDGKSKKVCHFQCDDHLIKYIERHKLLEKDYVAKYYSNPK